VIIAALSWIDLASSHDDVVTREFRQAKPWRLAGWALPRETNAARRDLAKQKKEKRK